MTLDEKQAVRIQAHMHANNLALDIQNASNRFEYMRLTRLAMEAESLAERLDALLA